MVKWWPGEYFSEVIFLLLLSLDLRADDFDFDVLRFWDLVLDFFSLGVDTREIVIMPRVSCFLAFRKGVPISDCAIPSVFVAENNLLPVRIFFFFLRGALDFLLD